MPRSSNPAVEAEAARTGCRRIGSAGCSIASHDMMQAAAASSTLPPWHVDSLPTSYHPGTMCYNLQRSDVTSNNGPQNLECHDSLLLPVKVGTLPSVSNVKDP